MVYSVSAYVRAHKRIERVKGSASTHECASCGSAAADWAYQYPEGEAPMVDTRGTVFSEDPDHYQPMCKRCHIAFDRAHDSHLEEIISVTRPAACGAGVIRRLNTPGGRDVFIAAGQKAAARRRRCSCGRVAAPGPIAIHQKASKHEGYEDLS